MILDNTGINDLVQAAADYGNVPQEVFQRKDGSFIYCAKGNFKMMKAVLNLNEQVSFVGIVNPSSWQKEATDVKV